MKLTPTLLAIAMAAYGAQAQDWRTEIRQLLDAQIKAWNRGDLEAFMQGYWNSSELTFYSGDQPLQGFEAALSRYRQRYQGEGGKMGRLAFADLKFESLSGETAFVRGRYLLDRDGERASGLFTLILRRFPAGWKIVHDHTSTG